MVAPAVGRQEGRHGGKNPTRGRGFPSKLNPFETVLTGDRGAETLLTFPLNSYDWDTKLAPRSNNPH
ncbi:hypothetical protein [Prochlorothrix hollandica]|uniref:hypothetical protein n=1 Tax=Prochlorothrix hollandica TaxID=1223 RepID=UPI00034562D8|nr:hypothetical protein [Prochlorothrix hollandica]